jgi:NitT/TauT family transport system substrate-binding protein
VDLLKKNNNFAILLFLADESCALHPIKRRNEEISIRNMKTKRFSTILIIGFFSLYLVSCNNKPVTTEEIAPFGINDTDTVTTNLRKVTFLPYWVANAQFAGYYLAKEMGIYKKHGIDLTIIPFQPFYTSTDLIGTGEADFAALWLVNAIEVKASGTDIVNIAQFSTRSSLMLLTKKSSGIDELEKMNHKRTGIWSGFELQPTTLFKKFHLDVEIVPIGNTNNLFLKDGVEITNANWFDEYHSIINAGFNPEELNTFFFADYGLNFLEDGIYCLSDKMKNNPKLCVDFVEATIEGWKLAFNNPEKAIDIVVDNAQKQNLPVNRVHQRWMLDRYRDLYYPEGKISTTLSEKDYLFAGKVLKESGLISEITPIEDFYHPYKLTENK